MVETVKILFIIDSKYESKINKSPSLARYGLFMKKKLFKILIFMPFFMKVFDIHYWFWGIITWSVHKCYDQSGLFLIKKFSSPFITPWIFEHIMVAWLTYTARVMAVSYFCLTPVGYFYHFRLLKNFKSQKKRKRTQRQRQFSTSKVKAKEETHKLTFRLNFSIVLCS